MAQKEEKRMRVYWNPYFGGFLLGILIIFTFYITGRGLGATGALKSSVVAIVDKADTEHAHENAYYSKFLNDEESPLNNWLYSKPWESSWAPFSQVASTADWDLRFSIPLRSPSKDV